MARRSPILGYNHNVGYRGLVFHVQTEDSGVTNPHIFTHLFHGGVILTTRRLDYDAEAADDVVKSLMQAQHKAVLKGLRRGEFDDKIDTYLGTHPELQPRKAAAETAEEATSVVEPAAAPAQPAAAPARAAASPQPEGTQAPRSGPFRPPTPIPPAPPPVPSKARPAADAGQAAAAGSDRQSRPAAERPPGAQPGTPAGDRGSARGNVLVSRPPIVVESGRPPRATPEEPARPARVPPARTVREDDASDGIFDQNLISEKSLDEVILAYLSEDSSEE